MGTLVIKSFPEEIHARLKRAAAAHRRSVTQEAIHLLDLALHTPRAQQGDSRPALSEESAPYWARREMLPAYRALLEAGALSGGTDSATILSEERDAR